MFFFLFSFLSTYCLVLFVINILHNWIQWPVFALFQLVFSNSRCTPSNHAFYQIMQSYPKHFRDIQKYLKNTYLREIPIRYVSFVCGIYLIVLPSYRLELMLSIKILNKNVLMRKRATIFFRRTTSWQIRSLIRSYRILCDILISLIVATNRFSLYFL